MWFLFRRPQHFKFPKQGYISLRRGVTCSRDKWHSQSLIHWDISVLEEAGQAQPQKLDTLPVLVLWPQSFWNSPREGPGTARENRKVPGRPAGKGPDGPREGSGMAPREGARTARRNVLAHLA